MSTHTVTLTIVAKHRLGDLSDDQRTHVEIDGDGGKEHMVQAFATLLQAAGYGSEVVSKVEGLEL